MKKSFTAPSLKVDLFNKELILQASMTDPINAQAAKNNLQVGMNEYREYKQLGIFDIFLD